MDKNIKKQIEDLRKEIRKHNDLYYSKAAPEISDLKYDTLLKELRSLESQYPEYKTPDSPTQTVGSPARSSFAKTEHVVPMLSLESINTADEFKRFDQTCKKELGVETIEYVCEPKLDGFSVELIYENGVFTKGATRGDGLIGEDVTENLKAVRNVLKKLKGGPVPARFVVRGEMLIHINDFRELNKAQSQSGKDAFANPRNAAAGAVRNLDPSVTSGRKLDVYCYRIMYRSGGLPGSHMDMLKEIEGYGLKAAPGVKLMRSIEEVVEYHDALEKGRDELDYEIDGIVVKVNEVSHQEKLGTRTNNPRWAVAYKFEPRKEMTRIEDIVVQVGRTGTLTPVALLKPVEVGGVTVSRATLHNMDEINRLDARVGDYVKVQRAGDVIPKVTEVLKGKRHCEAVRFSMPLKCPSCGTDVVKEDVHYRCPAGLGCSAQVKESMTHYASKDAVDIDGFSGKTLEQLYSEGLIERISDIYDLKKEDLLRLDGWKIKKTEKVLAAIEGSKIVTFDRFLFALGIRNVGKHIASLLANKFGSIEDLEKASPEQLIEINEIGPEIAESISGFFGKQKNMDEIERLFAKGVNIRSRSAGGILSGKKIVFTGSLETLTRSSAKKLVESEGGEVQGAVSSETDMVVAGDKAGSKLDKARQKGITILTEEEFQALLK